MEKIDYQSLAYKLFCFGAIGIFIYLVAKYTFGVIVPFLIAWGIAYLVYPLANELSQKTKLSRKVCSFVLMLLFLIIGFCVLFLIVNHLLIEAQNLFERLSSNGDAIAQYFENTFQFIATIGERLPIINKLQNAELVDNILSSVSGVVKSVWSSLLETLGSAVPRLATKVVTALPDSFLLLLVSIVACFYFAVDINVVNASVKRTLPPKVVDFLSKMKTRVGRGVKKYLKAYLIIFVITFVELLVGFWILGIDYSFILAFVIALIDFLPLLGTGAILAPWGIILLLMKNTFLGVGMLVLFIVTTIIRQVIEPKILGDSLGVHPLISLLSVYVGYKFFGFLGMILLPIGAVVLLSPDEKVSKNKAR